MTYKSAKYFTIKKEKKRIANRNKLSFPKYTKKSIPHNNEPVIQFSKILNKKPS